METRELKEVFTPLIGEICPARMRDRGGIAPQWRGITAKLQ